MLFWIPGKEIFHRKGLVLCDSNRYAVILLWLPSVASSVNMIKKKTYGNMIVRWLLKFDWITDNLFYVQEFKVAVHWQCVAIIWGNIALQSKTA